MSQSLYSFEEGVAIIADLVAGSGLTQVPLSQGPQISLMQYGVGGATTAPSGEVTTASYTGADIGSGKKPNRGFATFSFTSGTQTPGAALISQDNGLTTVAHVTASSLHLVFTDTKVDVGYFSGGVLTIVQSITYVKSLSKGGTKYRCGFELTEAGITVYLPDGTSHYVAGSEFFDNAGRYCQFESYTAASGTSTATFHAVTYEALA